MKKEKRDEQISSKVSYNTKNELKRIKKECNISSGDILTNYVENKSNINAHEILLKIKSLEQQLHTIERLEKEQWKLLKNLGKEHELVLEEIKNLEKLKPVDSKAVKDVEVNIKNTVKAYFDIRNQHTNVFGVVDVHFDKTKVGKTLCGRYDVTYDVFSKYVEMIDGGLPLNEFLTNDLSQYKM